MRKERELGAAAWGFRELELEEQLRICRTLGFSSLELGIANAPGDLPADAGEARIREVSALYAQYGIGLWCAATGNDFTVEPAEIRGQIDKVKAVIAICRKAKIRYLRIFAGFSPAAEVTGERWERMIRAINEAADFAADQGVVLAIETHGGVNGYADGVEHFPSVTTDREALERLLKEIRPTVAFVFDPANLAAAGETDLPALYRLLEDRIGYMHLKNFVRLPSGHLDPAAVGGGIWDIPAFLSESESYSGPYLIEYEKTETIEAGCRASLAALEKWRRA